MLPSYFVAVDNPALIRVVEVDDTFAYLETLTPAPATYAMPLADYDSIFIQRFRPATVEDLRSMTGPNFRMPRNAPASWLGEPAAEPV